MINKRQVAKICILSIAIFALLVNTADYFYSDYYVKGHYSEQNFKIMQEFNESIPLGSSYDKIDYTQFCMKIKPDSFFPIFYELSLWSGLLMIISFFAVIPIVILMRKNLSWRYKLAIAIILFITFIIYLEVGLIEVSYDFIGCGKYW